MAIAPAPGKTPTRGRAVAASVFVALVVIGVWKFIDYRMQPPPPPAVAVAAATG